MEKGRKIWYYSCMNDLHGIPEFNLFGETSAFPDILHCERIRDRALMHDWRISAHRHAEMVQIFCIEKGRASIWADGVEYRLKDQQFLFMPVRVVHDLQFTQGAEGVVLSFPLSLAGAIPDIGAGLSRVICADLIPAMQTLIGLIQSVFSKSGTFRISQLATLGQSLLAILAAEAAEADADQAPLIHRRMAEFDRLLKDRILADWGPAKFAQTMGITPGHLNRICRAATGVSASRYIETVQMTEARRLLAFTQLAIGEIGFRLGFDDPPYFSRRFRQVTGETPSAYRAKFAS